MSQLNPPSEVEMRRYIDEHMLKLRNAADPAWEPFDEFMLCLPLDQQYGIVRFCVNRGIAPSSPVWIIFALSQQIWIRASDAVHRTLGPVQTEAKRIEDAAGMLQTSLASLTDATTADAETLAFRMGELDKAVTTALTAQGAAFRRDAFRLKAWSVTSVVGALVLSTAACLVGRADGYQHGHADGTREIANARDFAKREQLKNMLSDPTARRSAVIRVYLDQRLRTL